MSKTISKTFLLGTCAAAVLAMAQPAAAQSAEPISFDIRSQPLAAALTQFAQQSNVEILFSSALARDLNAPAVRGDMEPGQALGILLAQSGLTYRATPTGSFIIEAAQDPQGGSAAGRGASTVEALIVTAQKREEDIQDVPIAISAFSQEDLTRSQIAGGPDLMTQIPNFTFTKTNFASYSIQIRGIGTQAISATVDPAVAVAFNNTPFIRNRFFEQEFYDLQRVEVLRGPQGTLYGRNATAGVVNLITARPKNFFEARVSADVGNYSSTRLEGMINLPLVEDAIALRFAGAWTKRDGYVTNTLKGEQTDGRDLWSARATLGIEPTEDFRAYLTYEHFEEDDDRLRSGKQLCTRHEAPFPGSNLNFSHFSQGCHMGSLYDDEAFQVPNGFGLPYYGPLANVGLPIFGDIDPYASTRQSKDLRSIETTIEPIYKAKTDIFHLAMEFGLGEGLTLTSETGYTADELFSFNDYNRFNTSSGVFNPARTYPNGSTAVSRGVLSPEGVFCDPQVGCADRLVAADVSTARSDQFSQEFQLSSDFDGPFNFHLGANYLRYDTVDKYYVFINTLTMYAADYARLFVAPWEAGVTDAAFALPDLRITDPDNVQHPGDLGASMYIDPNPISSLNDFGRNYFLSKNPFRLISYAAFGEAAYEITPDLKLTAGLRFTVDKKRAPIIPSWMLSQNTYGLPVRHIIEQEWREPTGRLVIDWKPHLDFTDETLVYASYAHGYKAGGVNPPLPAALPILGDVGDNVTVTEYFDEVQPPEFGPEFIDAFEVGTKNTLLDGRMTLNAGAFYYDYEGYQISQIANRSAVNFNFDAEVWGLELEVDWRPLENLKIGFRGGYEKTRVGEGQFLIDMIDRSAGDPDWLVRRPFPSIPSNCIIPTWLRTDFSFTMSCASYLTPDIDPVTQLPYEPDPTVRLVPNSGGVIEPLTAQFAGYPGFRPGDAPGGGSGIAKDIGGNELPNAPDFTTTLSVDYTIPLRNEWLLTLHGDFYRQSEAWTRIYNEDPYDKLKPFTQVNLAAIFTNEDAGWKIMAYIKNALDKDNITGAFLNSDDSGLTTNVFLNEPRLYGLRVTKEWTGDAFWTGRARSGPYPFAIEIGGGTSRFDAPHERVLPDFADAFDDPEFPFPSASQGEDLDWGTDGQIKLTWRPNSGPWWAAVAARNGRTNGVAADYAEQQMGGGYVFTEETAPKYEAALGIPNLYTSGPVNYAAADTYDREEHTIADFMIGRDVGLGGWGASRVGVGLRYAQLKSRTEIGARGIPDRPDWPEFGVFKYGDFFVHQYAGRFSAEREFEGVGPELAWDASVSLLGNEETGRLAWDVGLTGGVLFGRQEVRVTSATDDTLRLSYSNNPNTRAQGTVTTVAEPRIEDERVTVPNLGINLGLSYELDRVKVSTGYRWDRFFDAIDGGHHEHKDYDRTIDGPYLKLSVGFGG